MKRKLLLIVAILLLLVGCKEEKFYLDDENYGKSAIVDVTGKELKAYEEENKNMAVYVYLPGCSSCADFKKVLEEFTEEKNMQVYSISILDTDSTQTEDIEFAPSLALYKEGKVVDYLDSSSDEDYQYFKSSDKLTEWLENYIYLSK